MEERKRPTKKPSGNRTQTTGKIQQSQQNLEGGHQWPFIEEVVSITEDEDWSENEMYSAEDE